MSLTSLQNIPVIMRANGWNKGAFFLETWFNRAAYTKAAKGPTATEYSSAVNMGGLTSWLLGTDEGKFAYEKIFNRALWKTDNDEDGDAVGKLARILKAQNLLNEKAKDTPFGNKGYTAVDYQQNNRYVNASSFKTGATTTLTETVAALGSFLLFFGLNGKVTHSPYVFNSQRYTIKPESLDIYLWDSFDFVDDGFISQPLGCWDDSDNSVSKVAVAGGKVCVDNATFRSWRSANKKGGDYYIFSDVLNVPFTKAGNLEEFYIYG